ncbi:MAG: sphingosine kinase, partial [Deltaproteobacteria bacterium]|nr:sphingosine kinase [Deltaproteobacteria bacterium]
AKVTCDGQVWPTDDYLAIAAGTIDQIGLGFRPFPRAGERAGRFQALGITCPISAFLADMGRIRLGKPMTPGKTNDTLATRLEIAPDEKLAYMIDGDLHESDGPLRIGVGPRLRIVTS